MKHLAIILALLVSGRAVGAEPSPSDAPRMVAVPKGFVAPSDGYFLNAPGYKKLADRLSSDARELAGLKAENDVLKRRTEEQEAKANVSLLVALGVGALGVVAGVGLYAYLSHR